MTPKVVVPRSSQTKRLKKSLRARRQNAALFENCLSAHQTRTAPNAQS